MESGSIDPTTGAPQQQPGDQGQVGSGEQTSVPQAPQGSAWALGAQPQRNDAPFYCPSCGRRYNYPTACTGPAGSAAGHPAVEVVSTDELQHEHDPDADPGQPGYHTPAAPSDGVSIP